MATSANSRVTAVYAEALYEAAAGSGVAETIRDDIDSLRGLLAEYPAFARLLADPKIEADKREKILDQTFEGRVDRRVHNFLRVLNRRWLLGSLAAILAEYVRVDDQRRLNRREIEVVSATDLDEAMLGRIREGISAWGGFEPVIRVRQDSSLLGGLRIRIGDRLIDASVVGQLERLRERLKEGLRTGEATTTK